MKHDINQIKLPKDSRNEQLETISKNCFRPLFDVDKFILKEETIDNGIDFRIELKNDGKKIGFGLNFQLKSSEKTSSNKDGSYSKSIDTSNIEYLLNNGQSAYYGFYIVNEDKFYFENLKTIIFELNVKDQNWQNQSSHSIRFTKQLNLISVNEIYETTLKEGNLNRQIQSKLAENIGNLESNNKIIIDYDGNLDSDDEIEKFINKYGLSLHDNYKWNEILRLHNKTSIGSSKSALYDFVVGLSFLYSGSYLQSLEHFRKAKVKSNNLSKEINEYLIYYHAELCLLFGFIKEDEYLKEIQNSSKNLILKHYIELDKIDSLKSEMFNSDNFESKNFENRISEFITNKSIPLNLKFQAKISLLNYEAEKMICLAPLILASSNYDFLRSKFIELNKKFGKVLKEIEESNSNLLVYICTLSHNKFLIQFDAIYKLSFSEGIGKDILDDIIISILSAYDYFLEIGHMSNQVSSLSVLLEAYQSNEDIDKTQETILKLEEYVEKSYNPELKIKIEFIKTGGTFVNYMINKRKEVSNLKAEIEKMRNELIEIDELEEKSEIENIEALTIHLFPIGYFKFPKNEVEKVFNILGIESKELKYHYLKLFEIVIPIANIYVLKIENEGILNGNLEYRGIESYRKMYRIRKKFYENKFKRVILNT
jgi:hypothetical protein